MQGEGQQHAVRTHMRLAEEAAALRVDADGEQRTHCPLNVPPQNVGLVGHRDCVEVFGMTRVCEVVLGGEAQRHRRSETRVAGAGSSRGLGDERASAEMQGARGGQEEQARVLLFFLAGGGAGSQRGWRLD